MRQLTKLTLLGTAFLLVSAPASAQLGGLLDRVKRKADEAATEARELRRDADVESRAEAEVARERAEVERVVPNEQRVERQVTSEVENSTVGTAVRETERDANAITTADERAEAEVRGEARRTEAEVERATNVEGRARTKLGRTDAAVAAREVERDVREVTTADERAAAEARREADTLERSLDDITNFDTR